MKKIIYRSKNLRKHTSPDGTSNSKLTSHKKLLFHFRVMWGKLDRKLLQRKYRRQRAEKGYAQCDVYEVSDWFVKTVRSILTDLRDRTCNHPPELEFDEWRSVLSEMINLLELMDVYDDSAVRKKLDIDEEDMSEESNEKIVSAVAEAKNEFFDLFNKWFYHLWF